MSDRNVYLEDIPLDEARARFAAALREVGRWEPLPGEAVALNEALGRVTSEPVWARISSPHYHSAAMDGYALRARDTQGATETRPITLILGRQAYPVNTGDPLPPETDAVVMIEDTQAIANEAIEIRASVVPWRHTRLMGEDMVATEMVLPANYKIRPVDLGVIAGCGHHQVRVRRKPRVTIIPTGDELIPVASEPQPGQIIEYNSLMLQAQVIEAGGIASVSDIVPDDPARLRETLRQALADHPDLILVIAGSSAGDKDYTAAVIRELGKLPVHGVAVRPGHPVILGLIEDVAVIGVPGYPVSAALTGELFVQPLLARWLGQSYSGQSLPKVRAKITGKLVSPIGDDDFARVSLAQVGGQLWAMPLSRGAGVITSLARADGLAHIPRFSEGVNTGQEIEVTLYRPLDVIRGTVMAIGSHDPLLDLLGQFLAMRYAQYRLISMNVGSIGGLVALRRKQAHLAGIHLLDAETGEYNRSYIQQYLPNEAVRLITFAHREQGLMVAKGNPKQIQFIEDLLRIRFVNRQRGAGTRILLDYELANRGIDPAQIEGYSDEVYTHMAVAAAVASGRADCGPGVRQAANALNLDFISIGWERYDLCIPGEQLAYQGVQCLLEVLGSAEFRDALGQYPGYDTRETGQFQ